VSDDTNNATYSTADLAGIVGITQRSVVDALTRAGVEPVSREGSWSTARWTPEALAALIRRPGRGRPRNEAKS
jgi:hypothetical protein